LGFEIWRSGIAGFGRNGRAPLGEEIAHFPFAVLVTSGSWVGNPEIDLKWGVGAGASFGGPGFNFVGLHEESAAGAEATGVADGDGKGRRAVAGHGR